MYLLPILVVDSGPPALSTTGTLTIHVCGCDTHGVIQSCNATAFSMGTALSPGALIALLVCMLIIIGKNIFSLISCKSKHVNSNKLGLFYALSSNYLVLDF